MYNTDVKLLVELHASNPEQVLKDIIDSLDVAGGIVDEDPARDNGYLVEIPSGDSSEIANSFEEAFRNRSDVESGEVEV